MTDFNEVVKFKEFLSKYGEEVHLHDTCTGQSFSFERDDEKLRQLAFKFFEGTKHKIVFSDDGKSFNVV